MAKWQPGQSGNPAGRKPKVRPLTEILSKAGGRSVEYQGKKITGRRLMARYLWEGITTGKVSMPDVVLRLSPSDWLDLVKYIYTHVDGPPVQRMDHTIDEGNEVIIRVVHDD